MRRSAINLGLVTMMFATTGLVSPTPAVAAPEVAPQAAGVQLEAGNIILMQPGGTYQVQLAGKPAEVRLVQSLADSVDQIYVNGSMVLQYNDGDADGQAFLVQVTGADTLIYQHGLTADGDLFVHSVVFRFDGSSLVDAMKVDAYGYGSGWFELDQAYNSRAGDGQIVTKFGGITNTCTYAKAQISCAAKLPAPKFSGTLKMGRSIAAKAPQVGEHRAYLWYRCNAKGRSCNGIALNVKKGSAATGPTYKLRRADRGRKIRLCVDFRYHHWADNVCSKPSAKVK